MFIYSVTIHINSEAEDEWVKYMHEKHIAEVMAAGYFVSCSMRKLVSHHSENTGSYNMQYAVETEEKYHDYMQKAAPALQADVAAHFGGRFTAERHFYKIISETYK
jgi:hypothetical protein